ncbi:MAG: flagellar biosynthetic protein FliR [Pseudomonadota bacterium]
MSELDQLEALIGAFLLPFIRIAATVMVAPLFGSRLITPRIRIALSLAIAALLAPVFVAEGASVPLRETPLLAVAQEILLGVTMGFLVQMIFDAVIVGSQTIATSMGLGFATMVDPQRGVNVPVLSQFFLLLTTLMFLALDGHHALLEALAASFRTLPPGAAVLTPDAAWQVANWGSQMFAGALLIALPAVTALLIVNLGYGVISRAAPTLNLFAVGLPVSMLLGFVILQIAMDNVLAVLTRMLETTFGQFANWFPL